MANDTLNFTPQIYDYYRSVAYREPAVLKELREETAKRSNASMQIAAEQGAFMALLASLMGAKHIIEFGTFTGYSSLAMALATDAHFVCADVSDEYTAVARRYWEKAGVVKRMDLRLTGGIAVVKELLDAGNAGNFDLSFIDADKTGYDAYYEGSLKLLRSGGLIMIDNVLWGGEVADLANKDPDTEAIRHLNAKLQADERIQLSMVPIGDGLTLARKR